MFKIIRRDNYNGMVARYAGIRAELTDLYMRLWDLEDVALDSQFVLEANRITKFPEIADDIIDRIDHLNLRLKAIDPNYDEDDA
jgi:hypothetical protein